MALAVRHIGHHGPELVLLHGWGLQAAIWQPLVQELQHHCRITIVDLPGHGASRDTVLDTDLAAGVEAILAVVPTRALWLGWSLGGLFAQKAALLHPQRVQALVLVGASPYFIQAPGWDCGMPLATLAGFAEELAQDYHKTLVRFLSLQLGGGAQARALLRQLRKQWFALPQPAPTALQAGLHLLQHNDLRPALAEMVLPVQIMHGAKDKLVPLCAAEYAAQQLPQARLQVFDNAGHIPFLSHAEAFTQTLLAFCNEQAQEVGQ